MTAGAAGMGGGRRVAGFAGVLALAFGGALALGITVDGGDGAPVTAAADTAGDAAAHDDTAAHPEAAAGHAHGADGPASGADEDLGGLSDTLDGYSIVARTTSLAPGQPLEFAITGPDGAAVTSYVEAHTKELHLIAVEPDGPGYRHVHPTRDAAGRWLGDVDLAPGSWRVYADTVPADAAANVVLGLDLVVTGTAPDVAATSGPVGPLPPGTAVAGDLEVLLDGAAVAGQPTELAFAVSRAGREVATEPYLGALGHLVVVRDSDLAYLHVHPDTGALSFAATFPTAGEYRLFLDIQVDGTVRTAPFTVQVTG